MQLRRSVICALALALVSAAALAAKPSEMPITTSSPEARVLFEKARDMSDNLEIPGAIALFDQAIEKDPSFAMAYVLRATTTGSERYRDDIAKAAGMMARVSPGEQLWILAEKAFADGQAAAARKPLEELVQMFPADKHVRLRAGAFYLMVAREPALAMTHLAKATTIDPTFAAAYNLLGYVQVDQGQLRTAEKTFQKYIALLPNRPNPYDSYAELLMKMGRYDESIVQYRKALAKDPMFLSSLAGVGQNLVLKGDFESARQAFDQQHQQAQDADTQLNATEQIAKSYVAEGKVDRAIEAYGRLNDEAKAKQAPMRAASACFDAAFVLTQAGNLDEAKAWVSRAEAGVSEATLPVAVKARLGRSVHLAQARIHGAAGEFDSAHAELDSVRPAIEEAQLPSEMRMMNEVAGVLALEQHRYTEAVSYLAKADSRSPYVLFQQATAMAGAGQNAKAADLFRKVAEWNTADLGYAMVRDQAREKAATAPVATAGRKR